MVYAKAIYFAPDQRSWCRDCKALASKQAHQDRNDTHRFDLVVSGDLQHSVLSGIVHGISPAVQFPLDLNNYDIGLRNFDDEQSANAGADNLLIITMLIYEKELSSIACPGTLVRSK
jgi:hypothetical protein